MRAGGFDAALTPLAFEELTGGSLAGALHRGLLLQAVSLCVAAFDVSPWHRPEALVNSLVQLIVRTVEGACAHTHAAGP
jgi:hypothetical protein